MCIPRFPWYPCYDVIRMISPYLIISPHLPSIYPHCIPLIFLHVGPPSRGYCRPPRAMPVIAAAAFARAPSPSFPQMARWTLESTGGSRTSLRTCGHVIYTLIATGLFSFFSICKGDSGPRFFGVGALWSCFPILLLSDRCRWPLLHIWLILGPRILDVGSWPHMQRIELLRTCCFPYLI